MKEQPTTDQLYNCKSIISSHCIIVVWRDQRRIEREKERIREREIEREIERERESVWVKGLRPSLRYRRCDVCYDYAISHGMRNLHVAIYIEEFVWLAK